MRRSTPLAEVLSAEIARTGPISVADFMARCLWDVQHGYYATRRPLGQAGDFITAPEISQTFGELIGLWAAVVWRDLMNSPARLTLVELGPGRGTLLRDALRATRAVPGFHTSLSCHLVEASRPLIGEQQAALANSGVALHWSGDLAAVHGPAIVIANEFFDALPVAQWIKTAAGWTERCVIVGADGALEFAAGASTRGGTMSALEHTIVERRRSEPVIEQLGAMAARAPLCALVIDYGHEQSGFGDTLQAVRNHAFEHPLTSPGEADLSAQVDMAALAEAGASVGLVVDGPVTQAEFLGALGIIERATDLMAANPVQAGQIELAVARLMAPDGMGSRFKVLGLRSAALPPLPGLANRNRQ